MTGSSLSLSKLVYSMVLDILSHTVQISDCCYQVSRSQHSGLSPTIILHNLGM